MSGQIDVGWAGAPFGVDAVEQGRTRVIAKASDDPVLDKQTIRLVIANATELAQRKDVFVRFMRAYRETLEWVYSDAGRAEGLRRRGRASPRRPRSARSPNSCRRKPVDPDRISGLDDIMADAVTFKYMAAPLQQAQLDELIQIPERKQ